MNAYEMECSGQQAKVDEKKPTSGWNLKAFGFVVGFLFLLVFGALLGVYVLASSNQSKRADIEADSGTTIKETKKQVDLILDLQTHLNATEVIIKQANEQNKKQANSIVDLQTRLNVTEVIVKQANEQNKKQANFIVDLQSRLNVTEDGHSLLRQRINESEKFLYGPKSCNNVTPHNNSGGIYTIYPVWELGKNGVKVYCDFVTDGGVWLVFQKRKDGSENFNRGWEDYVKGFGILDGEFWLGLEFLHKITSTGRFDLRIDMEDFDSAKRYALYSDFYVGRGSNYAMFYSGYSGNAGNGLRTSGTRFSTHDRDQDSLSGNCAEFYKGGWWFANCHSGNPNGFYYGGPHTSYADGVCWEPFRGYHYSLKSIDLKLRRK